MERLPSSRWMTAPSVRAVIDALEAKGGRGCARFVGGCIRDTLLGRGDQVTDVDIATPLPPPQVIEALKAGGLKAVPTGIEHGTVTAISEGKPYEITTLRRDVETDGRRAVVAFTTSWEEDAQRRDFRLNALYAEPDGTLHDPTGGGLEDVAARRIVFVGDPETRIREDYLRILRFFRFLARVGDAAEADPAGLAACAKLKGGIAGLSGERIQQEMFKLLGSPDPVPAMRLMDETGVLAEAAASGRDVERLDGLVQVQEELGERGDPVVRLAALLPDTDAAARTTAERLKLSTEQRLTLLTAARGASVALAVESLPEARAAAYRSGADTIANALRLRWAASPHEGRRLAPLIIEAATFHRPFPVTGEEIKALGVPEGPPVGVIRKALEDWWVEGDFTATKAEALAELEAIVAKLSPP